MRCEATTLTMMPRPDAYLRKDAQRDMLLSSRRYASLFFASEKMIERQRSPAMAVRNVCLFRD